MTPAFLVTPRFLTAVIISSCRVVTASRRELLKHCAKLISRAREDKWESDTGKVLVDFLTHGEGALSTEEIGNQCITFLFAGHDTTSKR
jgi:cytochrome P450